MDEYLRTIEEVLMTRGIPLDMVYTFKSLGRLFSNNYDDWN